jgi:hypothetical protein
MHGYNRGVSNLATGSAWGSSGSQAASHGDSVGSKLVTVQAESSWTVERWQAKDQAHKHGNGPFLRQNNKHGLRQNAI